jgi:hypothetical protein
VFQIGGDMSTPLEFKKQVETIERFADKDFQTTQQAIEDSLTWEQKEFAYQQRIDELEDEKTKLEAELESLR